MFFCSRFSLFCVVGILSICFFADCSDSKKCVETERQALLRLKAGFVNGREVLSSWKGEDCCKWPGISCHNLTDHVTTLDLQTSYDSGALPLQGKLDSSICELQHLTSLNLSDNQLEGKIPKCIGSLGQLIELQLGENGFIGVIPPTLGNLSHLQTLQLSSYNNDLKANDLEWVSHLSNLRYLGVSSVNLSQAVDWLSSITKIPSLSELYLSNCGLPQVYPKSAPHLNSSTSLKELGLLGNNLNTLTMSLMLNVSKALTYLDLSGNELEGSLPESIPSLCQLKELYLSGNNFSGQLSDKIQEVRCAQNGLESLYLSDNPFSSGPLPDFSWLSSLRTLSLRNTNITGSFPQSLGHIMPHLQFLDLSHNRLTGVDSINETHLPNLSTLCLSFNELSGSISFFEITKLTSLEVLDLSQNQLNGSLPVAIGQFSNLSRLYLHSNKLNGSIIEAHLSNLFRLRELTLSHNSLSFNFNSNWIPPFQLDSLYASSCILGPKFPTWLKHQRELTHLEISNAGISDSLPLWDQLSSLDYLNVSYNKLSGSLPKPIVGRKSIYGGGTWDFSFNNLHGLLPLFPELRALFLSNNWFSGSLSSFCASSSFSLTHLDLSSNLLEGLLPNCWGKFQYLEFLNLAKNKLSGRIPTSFGSLQQMVSLHLNNNKFSGEIPSLARCTDLTILDLGDNNLQGTIPAWVGHHLHHLIVLSLRANKFQGRLPKSLCNLSFLQVLDLSQNNITGEISQCLNHMIALANVQFPRKLLSQSSYGTVDENISIGLFDEKATLAWKGEDREYGKNLGLMTMIDLSCNHLTGDIPQSLTKLVALAGLNLSHNYLTGSISNNIGQMKMLESLDLSRNYLYGRMPESFSNLSFLSYMNLSFNNLSGKIPLGTQLQSFDASTYLGNNGLCGPPLTDHCPGNMDSSARVPDKHAISEDTEEDELITFGFYVSLGLGFCVGFWGVFGSLVIKASWRHAYFRFFNNMRDQIHVKIVVFTARMKRS